MKRFLSFVLSFAAIGTLLSSWFAPRMIAWYFEPPVEIGVNCRPAVEWGLEKLQWAQMAGIAGGALLGLILWAFFKPRDRIKDSPQKLS